MRFRLCARRLPTLLRSERTYSTELQHLQPVVTRGLPLFHIQTHVVEASPTQPCTYVSFAQPFLRNGPTPATRNKVWSVPVQRDTAQNLLHSVASSRCRSRSYHTFRRQVPGACLVLRPQCVHLQVSCTCDPARMSTYRPAAASWLCRALIGSPIHVRCLRTCGHPLRPMTAA